MTMLSSDLLYNQLLASMSSKSLMLGTGEIYPCCKCGATFGDTKSLVKHELSHQKRKHECKECGKRFNSSSDLKRHSLIHTNTRPYKCHLCPTAFVQQAHLTRHLKSHTRHGVRFKCLGCGTMFLHSTNVRWHQQFCTEAQGTNGGYVVTQSEGEGIDPSNPNKIEEKMKTKKPLWTRDNRVYYFNGGKGRRHSSSSSEADASSSSTDGGYCEPGANSFMNSNRLLFFDGPYDKTELWNRPKSSQLNKNNATQLSSAQLSFLNSRVSMVASKTLKTTPPQRAPDHPASTEDLLKLLAALQEGQQNGETETISPNSRLLPNGHINSAPKLKASPPSSYKIVPNKIIQHNVTSSNSLMTSSNSLMTSSNGLVTSSNSLMTSPNSLMASYNSPLMSSSLVNSLNSPKSQEDRIKPIVDIVKKLVAEGLQLHTADVILGAISRYLGNVMQSPSNMMSQSGTSSSFPPFKKRKLGEPEQKLLGNNLLTSQNLLASNLYPLLQQQTSVSPLLTSSPQVTSSPHVTSSTSLSFTPLMFRQFPRIGDMPPQTSLFNTPSFKPSSAFASELFQLANQSPESTARDVTASNQKQADVPREYSSPFQETDVNNSSGAATPTSEVRKPAQQSQRTTSEKSPQPMRLENTPPRAASQPIVKQETVPRDCTEPMGEQTRLAVPESGLAGPGQATSVLERGLEASKNIAFHRLSDLLSFV